MLAAVLFFSQVGGPGIYDKTDQPSLTFPCVADPKTDGGTPRNLSVTLFGRFNDFRVKLSSPDIKGLEHGRAFVTKGTKLAPVDDVGLYAIDAFDVEARNRDRLTFTSMVKHSYDGTNIFAFWGSLSINSRLYVFNCDVGIVGSSGQ